MKKKKERPYLMNKYIFFGVIPARNKTSLANNGLKKVRNTKNKGEFETPYLLMNPYPLRTLNHFTVPWTKVATTRAHQKNKEVL